MRRWNDGASEGDHVAEDVLPKGMHRVVEVLEAGGRDSNRMARVRWEGADANGAVHPTEWIPLADLSADLRSRWKDPFARQVTPAVRVPWAKVVKERALEEERRCGEEAEKKEKECVDREVRAAARSRR